MSEEVRARALQVLGDLKTRFALRELQRIAREAPSPRLSANASLLRAKLHKQLGPARLAGKGAIRPAEGAR
jgi:hypothetical protein